MTDSCKTLLLRFAILTGIILAVYGNTLNHRFVWDDINIIVENPLLGNLGNIPKFFLAEDRFGDPTGYYRPITYLSFALERAVWGLNPVGYNITNLVLHIAVTLLFYLVVSALFKKEQLAFVAALLFSLHPIAGETINFHAGGRNTLLCACFALLSLYFYINKRHIPAVLCFTVAIFSKEFALLLPAVLFIYDKHINKEKFNWFYYVPYAVAITFYLAARSFAVENANFMNGIKVSGDLLIAPYIIVKYFINMVFPIDLKVLNDVYISRYTTIICLVLVILSVSVAFYYRKNKEIVFSVCWFLLFLLPVINIIPLPSATLLADRYAYFSSMGFGLALAYFICKGTRQVVITIVLVLCTIFSIMDIQRNGIWKDEPSLFSRMIKDAPEKALGYHNLGRFYYKNGDLTGAVKYLKIACSKEDVNSRMLGADALVFWEANELDMAATLLLKKLEFEPDNPQPYIMLSRIYEQMGNRILAKTYHDKAEALFPGIEDLMNKRAESNCRVGEKLMAEHKLPEAENLFKEALGIIPDFIPALINMGSLSAQKKDFAGAEKYFAKAVALDPSNATAHYNLSMTYELMGKSAEAQEEMKNFRGLDPLSGQRKELSPQ